MREQPTTDVVIYYALYQGIGNIDHINMAEVLNENINPLMRVYSSIRQNGLVDFYEITITARQYKDIKK